MKIILFINLSLLMMGCGELGLMSKNTELTPSRPVRSEDLKLFVEDFENTYSQNVSFSVTFKPSSEMKSSTPGYSIIGLCQIYSSGFRQVFVNESWWGSAGDNARKILIFHELGHCQLNRDHDTRISSDGRPYSLMYPIIDPVLFYYNTGSANYYLTELSNPNQGSPIIQLAQSFITLGDGTCQDLKF